MHMDKAFSDITIDLHQINAAYVALASMIFDRFISGLFIAFIAVYCHLYRRTFNVCLLRRQLIREQNRWLWEPQRLYPDEYEIPAL